jgi:tetratricopeptide (TPR) repeat protein
MVRRLVGCLCLSFFAFSAPIFADEGSWVGKEVILKKPGIHFVTTGKDGKEQDLGELTNVEYRVIDEDEMRIKVRHRGKAGWLAKADCVLPEEAFEYFTRCILSDEKTPEDYSRRSLYWEKRGELSQAFNDVNEALRQWPTAGILYNARGNLWFSKGAYDKALADFSEMIRLNPKGAKGYYKRSLVWVCREEFEKALADLDEAIRLDPNCIEAFTNRGAVLYQTCDYTRALEDFDRAIQIDADHALSYINRGAVWRAKKEYEKSLADYEEGLRIDPNVGVVHVAYAWFLATCPDDKYRDGKKAVEHARRAWELRQGMEARCADTLAAAYATNENFEEAVKWQKFALVAPGSNKEFREKASQRL